MTRLWLMSGSLLGFVAVAAGSFGAHGLKDFFATPVRAVNWETAVRYCLFHSLALLIVGLFSALPQATTARNQLALAGWLFLIGTLLFSGFLAAHSLTGVGILAAVVPVGGLLLLIGWVILSVAGFQMDFRSVNAASDATR